MACASVILTSLLRRAISVLQRSVSISTVVGFHKYGHIYLPIDGVGGGWGGGVSLIPGGVPCNSMVTQSVLAPYGIYGTEWL